MAANKSMFWRLIFQALRLRLQRVFIIFSALLHRCSQWWIDEGTPIKANSAQCTG